MSLNIHIPATQHAVQSCCAGFAATARQTWCAHFPGARLVCLFAAAQSAQKDCTVVRCSSLANRRTGMRSRAIFPGSASHRSEIPSYFPLLGSAQE